MAIENISDTARWVAVYRAQESARPDAIFKDPFAERLAGERGHQILREMPKGQVYGWPMVVRTALFDEIIRDAVLRRKVDLVVNLAAGLDARPWRLPLPASVRWVDVDLPEILAYKTETLQDEKTLFSRLGASSKHTLILSEGLLIYLTPEQVATLAEDLHAQPSFAEWLIDLASPQLLKRMEKTWGKKMEKSGVPFRFAPAENTKFFEPHGWREVEFRATWEESQRLHRTMKGAWIWNLIGRLLPKHKREEFRRFSGIVLLERV
jgi:O-methyltransferase involved in polyketide biosynthesis